jgi:hypothetical protein
LAVDINIPGIGVVSANNAAQDSTLNAILSAIQAQTGTTTNVSSAGLSAANQQGIKYLIHLVFSATPLATPETKLLVLENQLATLRACLQRLQHKSFLALACLQVKALVQAACLNLLDKA